MGSIAHLGVDLGRATRQSKRIVVGRVLEKSTFRFPGSPEAPAMPEGRGLHTLRIRVQRTLKGPEFSVGGEHWVFSSAEWFHHTHAEVIKGGEISYVDAHYSEGIQADQIETGMDILLFLSDEPAPLGFPPESVFLMYGESHDRGAREKEVVRVLQEVPLVDFDLLIPMTMGGQIRFPDHSVLRLLSHGHKRPTVGGPTKEWITLELSKDGQVESLDLAHTTDIDSREVWESRTCGAFMIEVRAMTVDQATLVFRKNPQP